MIGLDILAKTYSLARALLSGQNVPPEQLEARLTICRTCEKVVRKGNIMRCDICGCQVAESGLVNLARYVETPQYGCKFPGGSKWLAAGC